MSIQKHLLCLYQFNIQVIEKIMKFIKNFQLHIVFALNLINFAFNYYLNTHIYR